MAEFLLEILSEEIPARMQARAIEDLARMVADGLTKAGLSFEKSQGFVTPRRLTLVIDGLPEATPDISEERRGPRVGAPQQAIDGFLKANDISLDQTETRDTGKGEFYFAIINKRGRPTADLLQEIVEQAMADFPWPKSMRWGAHECRWVRPLHSILALFGGKVVPVQFGPITAGDSTVGHRFLAPARFSVSTFAEYADKLGKAFVMLDQAKRRALIEAEANKMASSEGLVLRPDEGLIQEVTGLVEWPVVLMGSIDKMFMDVPSEVLITAMRSHQKYFATQRADGTLAARFVFVANMVTEDGGAAVISGNERVLRARLSDAKFFWDADRKKPLEEYLPKLRERVFHAQLGSVEDKVQRVQALGGEIAKAIKADAASVSRAALLAKADLSTGIIGEFPELQGVMGSYYARHCGETPEIAQAVAEHYSPLGPNDACPSAPVSVAVALADKIDTLVGFFAIDEKPTGSKDPFALRRAALGVIRLIVENGLRFSLAESLRHALAQYGDILAKKDAKTVIAELMDFFADRLKVALREKGVRHDLVDAVFGLGGGDDLVRLLARVDALRDFVTSADGANLIVAYRRAANIVRIEEKKDKASYDGAAVPALFVQDEEKELFAALDKVGAQVKPLLDQEKFAEAMAALSRLRAPVDAFFDRVTVNAEEADIRANRLRLLSQIGAAMGEIADFSKIEG